MKTLNDGTIIFLPHKKKYILPAVIYGAIGIAIFYLAYINGESALPLFILSGVCFAVFFYFIYKLMFDSKPIVTITPQELMIKGFSPLKWEDILHMYIKTKREGSKKNKRNVDYMCFDIQDTGQYKLKISQKFNFLSGLTPFHIRVEDIQVKDRPFLDQEIKTQLMRNVERLAARYEKENLEDSGIRRI